MLSHPGFRRLWAVGALNSTMRWLEMVVLGLLAFELTDSAFQVALAFVFRMMPMLLFGIVIGMIADRMNRKFLLVSGLATQGAIFGSIGFLTAVDLLQYWHLVLGTFLSGVIWASEFPVRRAMIGELMGVERIGRAMGADSATTNFTRMIGPFVGGGLFAVTGAEGAYLLGVLLFGSAAAVAWTLTYQRPAPSGAPRRNLLAELAQGFGYIKGSTLLVGALAVTILANVFAFPHQSMVPVIGEEILKVGAVRIGLLSSIQGLGAVLGSLLIAAYAGPRHYTRIYLYGTALFMITIMLFAWSEWYALSLAFMFVSGFGMTAFGTMQSTITVAAAAPEMRGRVLGALSVSIGAQPAGQLGLGVVAEMIGAQMGTLLMAAGGLVTMVVAGAVWPILRRADSMEAPAVDSSPTTPTLEMARKDASVRAARASGRGRRG